MTRLSQWGIFPTRYALSSQGLALAEQELDRLVEQHTAYASQPHITRLWQGYIDKKARSVATQRVVVERLGSDLAAVSEQR
jgi:hypothetical protein